MTSADRPRLLIVEDDIGMQKQLKWCFEQYDVLFASTRQEAIAHLRRYVPAVVLQDLGLPPDTSGVDEGLKTLREVLQLQPGTKVIVVTGNGDRDNAVRAVSMGAYDFCQKPVDVDVLRMIVGRAFYIHRLEEENRQLRYSQPGEMFEGLYAADEGMLKVCHTIERIAASDMTVLLVGESGVGKGIIARALHRHSGRAGPFVQIRCAGVDQQLLQDDLLGVEQGSVSGIGRQTPAKLDCAHGGTLFVQEVGDMAPAVQHALLHRLNVGGVVSDPRYPDVRLVCSTSRKPEELIAEQRCGQEFLTRISQVRIDVPALRERPGAPTVIAHSLLRKYAGSNGRLKRGFTQDAIAALESYGWPGNLPEIENRVKTAIIMGEHPLLSAQDLNLETTSEATNFFNLKEVRARAERQAIQQTLEIAGGNVSRAAELLGVSRPTLYDLMEKYSISN